MSKIFRQGIYRSSPDVSFYFNICLQTITKKDGSDSITDTQSGTIANAVKIRQEKGVGDHWSSGCYGTATGQPRTQGADSFDEDVVT